MSYRQTFRGTFSFADAHHLEAGLDGMAAVDDTVIDIAALPLTGNTVAIDKSCTAPAGMYEPTLLALHGLARYARSGRVAATLALDGLQRDRVPAGGGSPDRPPHRKWELYVAVKTGDTKKLATLIATGVELDKPIYRDVTAQHVARNAKVIAKLLAAGARPNGEALVAACGEREAVALALIAAGAKVPARSRVNALALCAANRQVRVLSALLAADSRLAKASAHPDVMQQAILSRDLDLVETFVAHGAKLPPNCLDLAITANSHALAEIALRAPGALKKAGPSSDVDDAMCRAAWKGDIKMMKLLAKAGVPLHPARPGFTFPLRNAANADDKAVAAVRWLLAQGVPVNARSSEGSSALWMALVAENEEVALYLADRGADCDVVATLDRRRLRKISARTWQKLLARVTRVE